MIGIKKAVREEREQYSAYRKDDGRIEFIKTVDVHNNVHLEWPRRQGTVRQTNMKST